MDFEVTDVPISDTHRTLSRKRHQVWSVGVSAFELTEDC